MSTGTVARRLHDAIERLRRADRKVEYDWLPNIPVGEEPSYVRGLKTVSLPPDVNLEKPTVQEARDGIREAMLRYCAEEYPGRILLIRVMPGIGKTFAAVQLAEELAKDGKRVMYAGPRHDLYPELLQRASDPSQWYEWLPRQFGDDNKIQTCLYEEQINKWLKRGHDAMAFCSGVCGWDFVKSQCIYHRQKNQKEPIIYGQHAHIALGHPLRFDVIIGDESPIGAFSKEWEIPARYILPDGMDYDDPITHVLHLLQGIATNIQDEKPAFGPELIEMLGGADEVIAACEQFILPIGNIEKMSEIRRPEDVEKAPYFHLFDFVPLLKREAKQYQAGNSYPHRIYLSAGKMTLLLRHKATKLPEHVIWLDATGQERIYQELFDKPVEVVDIQPKLQGRVYQVVDRAWGKNAVKEKGAQLKAVISEIVRRYPKLQVSVFSFKNFVSELETDATKTGHFYAARGTNEHELADVVVSAGTPQANIYAIVRLAKMIFFTRNVGFKAEWVTRDVVYEYRDKDGKGRSYPVAGFWNDDDLQVVLQAIREDEILQTAHRGRPAIRNVDTWLLTSVPIIGFAPDEILTMRDFMGTPKGVNVFQWEKVKTVISDMAVSGSIVIRVKDLQTAGLNYATARKYLKVICDVYPGAQLVTIKQERGGPELAVEIPIGAIEK